MKSEIPVQNLYYLLLYAWDVLEESDEIEVNAAEYTQLVDLFARVLHCGTEHILRRGLDRGYQPMKTELSGVRGKIDFSASVKAATSLRARLICDFDELTHDVPHNRIVKATIRQLLFVPDLDKGLREELAETYRRLHDISDLLVSDSAFRSVQLNQNNRHYRLLMEVCRIVYNAYQIEEAAGETSFRDFFRDERRMRLLFERFVRNFYRREQTEFRVCRNRLDWTRTNGTAEAMDRLPLMRTDVRLRSSQRLILVETKFVPRMFQAYFGKSTLRSGHLYQVFAYLMNLAEAKGRHRSLEAIPLYPAVGESCDLQYEMFGHRVRVYALNLEQTWPQIHDDLLKLLQPNGRRPSA